MSGPRKPSAEEALPRPDEEKMRKNGTLAPGKVLLRRWDGALVAVDEEPKVAGASEKRRRKPKQEK